jgi:outer membrane receptor protein involved in Fe transport
LFYSDGFATQGNPNARPEADTAEVDVERKLGRRMNVQASAYGYRLRDFLVGTALANGLIQYLNTGTIEAAGVEFEINGRPADWLETTASYAAQRSRNDGGNLSNSPNQLAKLRFAVPLGRKLNLSSGMQYSLSRLTVGGNTLRPVYLADLTLATRHLTPDLDVRFGLRNAFNLKSSNPVALCPIVDSMPQPGRSFFVELIAHRAR